MSDSTELLERFGLITEEDFARMLGITVRTLKNRGRLDLPSFVKAGRKRLFHEDAVRAYLQRKTVGGSEQ